MNLISKELDILVDELKEHPEYLYCYVATEEGTHRSAIIQKNIAIALVEQLSIRSSMKYEVFVEQQNQINRISFLGKNERKWLNNLLKIIQIQYQEEDIDAQETNIIGHMLPIIPNLMKASTSQVLPCRIYTEVFNIHRENSNPRD